MATSVPTYAEYKGNSGLAGGWALDLKVHLNEQQKLAFGEATIDQPGVQGDPSYKFQVSGPIITMATMKSVHFGLRLQSQFMPGRHIDINAVLDQDWKSGDAIVNAWLDTPQGTIYFQVKLEKVA